MKDRCSRFVRTVNLPVLLLQIFLIAFVIVPETGSAFRENDGGSYISGAYQLNHGQASPLHNSLYNYDKQYGAFGLLALAMRLFAAADPLLTANVLQVVLVALGMLACAFLPQRGRGELVPLVSVLLCPVWLLSAPFFSPASMSGAALFLAIAALESLRRPWSLWAGSGLALVAVAFRADAILLIPLLIWSHSPRMSLKRLIRRPWVVALCILASFLLVIGRLTISGAPTDREDLIFNPRYLAVAVMFGFGASALVYGSYLVGLLRVSLVKRAWGWWYLAGFVCALPPFAFYIIQLYSPRYFFLTNLAGFCLVASRRFRVGIPKKERTRRLAAAALLFAAVVPWVAGLNISSLHHIRPSITNPTRFPTGDGHMPAGAYLAFVYQVTKLNRLQIDHSQQIWLSASSVKYDPCGASVPVLRTPMASLLQPAVRLHGQQPIEVLGPKSAACAYAYADLRSLVLRRLPNELNGPSVSDFLPYYAINIVSPLSSAQQIVKVDFSQPPGTLSRLILAMRERFASRQIEFRFNDAPESSGFRRIVRDPWAQYVFFSASGWCDFKGAQPVKDRDAEFSYWTLKAEPEFPRDQFQFFCTSPSLSGYVRDVLPPYMNIAR